MSEYAGGLGRAETLGAEALFYGSNAHKGRRESAGKRIEEQRLGWEIWGEFGQRSWWRRRSVLGFLVRALGLSGEAEQRRAWNTSTYHGVPCDIPEPVMARQNLYTTVCREV
jgi:hypothetical protein